MRCKEGAIELIDRIKSTIAAIPDEDFNRPLEIYNGTSIGEHFRHIYDFFHCLVDQCDSCEMDYARRMRDQRISSERSYCMSSFEHLRSHIDQMDESAPITVTADFMVSDGSRPVVQSSIGRELMYAYDHAIHHLAIIKIGVTAINPTIPINQDLGVAASTIRHRDMR